VGFEKQRIEVLERIHSLDDVIRGSVFEMKRFCGRENCRCARTGIPHKSMFLSFKYQGRTRMIPIKKEQIPKIKKRIKDYKELKAAIDELARINAELLRGES
jgi:hypothetical protein